MTTKLPCSLLSIPARVTLSVSACVSAVILCGVAHGYGTDLQLKLKGTDRGLYGCEPRSA